MRRQALLAATCAGLCLPGIAPAQAIDTAGQPPKPPAVIIAPPTRTATGAILLPRDTLVRLMVTKEVNSRDAKEGDRFLLRVDEDVVLDGVKVIPVGAKAVGEIVHVQENGAVGKSGRLGARLLHVQVGEGEIPIRGEQQTKGPGSSNRVIMSMIGFGVFGLLTKGNAAKLKAGEIFNGYVSEDMAFDPATAAFVQARAATTAAEAR